VPGAVVGDRYRIVRVIARGGTGVVYEAEHTWTGRRVAVKMLLSKLAGGEAQTERFRREARSAARLSHPHIVEILDMGRDAQDGALFLVQALLVGEDLEQRLERPPPMGPEELLKVMLPLLDALRLAHQQGVLHRDLKPSNIFLVASAEHGFVPKLIDFGASKLLDEGADRLKLTRQGVAVGTPVYMSPEQLRGEPLDARSDIWSLGVVMYRALTGRLPFDTATFAALVDKRSTRAAAPPIERRDVPRRLVEVVHRALAMDREARFPTVAAMLDVLHAPLSLPPGPPGEDDQTLVDGGLYDLLQRARRGLPAFIPPIGDDLTNVPAENERMEESVDERAGTPGQGAAMRVVAEPTPTPTPRAIRRPPVLARPARHPGRKPWHGRVRMGLVAAHKEASADVLRQLEETLTGTWSLRRFPSYSTLIDALCEEEVELAWLPPVAYLRARQVGPVHLLLALERAEGPAYGSALVASPRAGIQSLREIRGKHVAWVDVWSAAGYLMPRGVIRGAGFDPEQVFASQTFVGSHAAVLDALEDGRADVGATYCSLDEHGALVAAPWSERPGLRPIALSGAIPGDAICGAGEIALEDAEAMVEPLIALSAEPRGPALMSRVFGAGRFVEVDPSYYQALEGV
jgi:serine/threonine-protein kinase